jgi:hypothetical protein
LFIVFLVLGIFAWDAMTAEAEEWPPFHVGYRVLDFEYRKDGLEKFLTVAVWYPTAAKPGPHDYGGPTNGLVAAVLLFSTGAGGYLFRQAELAAVRIPSMPFMGERERDQMRKTSKSVFKANRG